MRKLSQINERLFNSGVKRATRRGIDGKRTEELTPFDKYLKEVKWIDMGHPDVLFSEYDFPIDLTESDENLLSIQDVLDIDKRFEREGKGVAILGDEHYEWLNENTKKGPIQWSRVKNPNFKSHIECWNGGNRVLFNLAPWKGGDMSTLYLTSLLGTQGDDRRIAFGTLKRYGTLMCDIQTARVRSDMLKNKNFCIKLIKQKN